MKGRSKDRRYGTMKIVIIGSSGRLGAALMREYRDRYDVAGFNRAQLDLSNLNDVRAPKCRAFLRGFAAKNARS